MQTPGERLGALAKAYEEMNLWRIPRMEIESPTLLVYEFTLSESAAKIGTRDVSAQLAGINYTTEVRFNSLDDNDNQFIFQTLLYI